MTEETVSVPFDLKVSFSGLCHYVPIGEESRVRAFYKDGVHVMFPFAEEHSARVELLRRNDDGKYEVVGELPIRLGEVKLAVSARPRDPRLEPGVYLTPSVERALDRRHPDRRTVVYGALPFHQIARDLADADDAIVRTPPRNRALLARLRLEYGDLVPDLGPDETVAIWRLPRPIAGSATSIAIGLGFLLTIRQITAATINVRTPFSEEGETVDLSRYVQDGVVTARVAYRCDRPERGTIDADFEHHYKMIRTAVYDRRRQLGLAFPLPQLLKIIPLRIVARIEELESIDPRSLAQEMELRALRVELRSILAGSGCNCLGALGLARKIPVVAPEGD